MPRIPTAENLGQRPTPSVRGRIVPLRLETPRTAGIEQKAAAELGQSIAGLGEVFGQLAKKEKHDLDQARTEEALNLYQNGLHKLELDEKEGFANIKGGDAVKRPVMEEYRKKREELRKQVLATLGSDEQTRAFNPRASVADRMFDTRIYQHVAKEGRAYQGMVHQGALETERKAAQQFYEQPGAIELSILRTHKEVERKARFEGLNPERPEDRDTIEALKLSAETNIHSDVIATMMMKGQDQVAAQYYNAIKDRLTPEATVILGSKVQAASKDGEAMRGADAAWAVAGPKMPNDPVRLDVMEQMIREKYQDNPSVAKAAVNELRSRVEAHNATQRELTAANKATILDGYNSGKSLRDLQLTPEWSAMSGTEREQLTTYMQNSGWTAQQRARADAEYAEGQLSKQGFSKYLDYSHPAVLSGMTEAQIKALEPEIGRELMGRLIMGHRKLVDAATKKADPDKVRAATIDTELFNSIADEVGLKPFKQRPSEEHKAQLGRLKNMVESAIDARQQQVGAPLQRDEKEKLMRSILDKKVMTRGFFEKQIPAAVVAPRQREKIYVPYEQIPQKWVEGALNLMRSTGAVPQTMNNAKAAVQYRKQLERAYAIGVAGGSQEERRKALGVKGPSITPTLGVRD